MIVLILVLLLALFARLPHLNSSFWLDEAAQALESSRPLSEQLAIAYDFQPPLLHLLLHAAIYISDHEWWLRTVGALIPGLITVWATYQLGKKFVNQTAAWLAALLLATNSFHIFYSQELRPYSLPAALGTVSWLLILEWTDGSFHKKRKQARNPLEEFKKNWRFPTAIAVVTLLGLYSSYLYPFLLFSQLTYLVLLQRKKLSQFLIASPIWIFGFSIWLPMFFQQLAVGSELRSSLPGWDQVVSISQGKSLLLVFGKFVFGVLDIELTPLFIGLSVGILLTTGFLLSHFKKKIGIAALLSIFHKKKKQVVFQDTHAKMLLVLFVWLVIPLFSAWLVSFWVPVLRPKRVLYLLPAFYLAITTLVVSSPAKKLKVALIGVLLSINVYGTFQYYLQPRFQRENWRQLHQLVVDLYPTNSVAVFSFDDPFAPWTWYDDGSYPTHSTGYFTVSDLSEEDLQSLSQYEYLLVFEYLRDLTDPSNTLIKHTEAMGYTQVNYFDQENIGFVKIYGKPIDSTSSTPYTTY